MGYTNSPLISFTLLSPNHSGQRNHAIDTITIHHMAGNLSVESCGRIFSSTDRQASSNYGIGSDGRVGLYVEEKNRSWCSSSRENDNRAITIEVANDDTTSGNWHVSDTALAALIDLCVDICRRNGIPKLNYTGDKSGNLTMHKWFASTLCPGPYLGSKFPYIAAEVNRKLAGAVTEDKAEQKPQEDAAKNDKDSREACPYIVRVSIDNLNIRKGPGTNYARTGLFTRKGIFTIVAESDGVGASRWGRLKSGAGWISLDYVDRV